MSRTVFETKLNVLVGRLLSKHLFAISERIEKRGRPDIVIFNQGLKIVLEGSYSKSDAEDDARRRLEVERADIAIALNYIRSYPLNVSDGELEELLRNSEFDVKVIVPLELAGTIDRYLLSKKVIARDVTEWQRVNLAGLIRIIKEASEYLVLEQDLTDVIAKIESWIDEFATATKSVDGDMGIAKRLYDIFYKLYGLSVGDLKDVQELMYAKAGLILLLSSILYQSVRACYGFDDLSTLTHKYGGIQGLTEAFKCILTKGYGTIYRTTLEIISTLPPELDRRINRLVEISTEVASKRLLLRKDFSGKVYHRIVGEWSIRKGFATYYTSIPAAYLLAYLAIFTPTGIFKEPPRLDKLKVCDFACGSGTLLTASYSALQDRCVEDLLEEFDSEAFHKTAIEKTFWGFDALKYAVQITATNLVLQNPMVPLSTMNTYTLPLGLAKDKVKLGSLEFLRGLSPFILETEKVSVAEEEQVILSEITPRSINLIVMNPPFTRATGRGGKEKSGLFGFIVEKSARERVVREYSLLRESVRNTLAKTSISYLKALISDENLLRDVGRTLLNIGQAGEGLLFLYLAYKYVAPDGKIAFVLPKSLLTGASWFSVRSLLLDKFHIEHVILSYDPEGGYNFSESTNLSEILMVARARDEHEEIGEEGTRFTVLLSKPKTSLEARGLAMSILHESDKVYSYVCSNHAEGYSYLVSREYLAKHLDNWGRLACFPDPYLTHLVLEVFDGYIFDARIPIRRLGEIATIGIDRHQFHDQFARASLETPGACPSVYGGEEEVRLRMLTSPNARILARNNEAIETFQKYSSNLLIPDRIRVNTTHAMVFYSTEPVLSNIFYAVRLDGDERKMKALALWLNTTWGVLSTLANRSETEGGWINLKMTHWRLQPVLDVVNLDEGLLTKLSKVFDDYAQSELRRLPEQFNPEDPDPIRRAIDEKFLEALNVTVEEKVLLDVYRKVHESLSTWLTAQEEI
jgi:hypothetical protein